MSIKNYLDLGNEPASHAEVLDEIMELLVQPVPAGFWHGSQTGEWSWIDEGPRSDFVESLASGNREGIGNALASFPGGPAWFGLASPPPVEDVPLRTVLGGALVDVDTFHNISVLGNEVERNPNLSWWTNEVALWLLEASLPHAGKRIKPKSKLLPDTPRHLFFATKMLLSPGIRAPRSILEIGPGYGGNLLVTHKLAKILNLEIKMMAIDQPTGLVCCYYFLRRHGLTVSSSLGGQRTPPSFSADVHLMSADTPPSAKFTVDAVLNCRSMSEMSSTSSSDYLGRIEHLWRPTRVLLENADALAFPDSPRHLESLLSDHLKELPSYEVQSKQFSTFTGGQSRYFYADLLRKPE